MGFTNESECFSHCSTRPLVYRPLRQYFYTQLFSEVSLLNRTVKLIKLFPLLISLFRATSLYNHLFVFLRSVYDYTIFKSLFSIYLLWHCAKRYCLPTLLDSFFSLLSHHNKYFIGTFYRSLLLHFYGLLNSISPYHFFFFHFNK